MAGRVYFYTDPTNVSYIGVNGVGMFHNGQYADLETYYEIRYGNEEVPPGYTFTGFTTAGSVTVGADKGPPDHYHDMVVSGNGSVTAHFTYTPPPCAITFYTANPVGGSIWVSGIYQYTNGQSDNYYPGIPLFGASPPEGFVLDHWSQTGGLIIADPYNPLTYVTFPGPGTYTITATWKVAPSIITVNTSPGGLDAPSGGGAYTVGQTAHIGVSSVGGYTFLYWTRDGSLHTYDQTFDYLVDASHTFTALFSPAEYVITVNTSPSGLDSPSGGGSYQAGQTANIGVNSVTGYTFQYWTRDGSLYSYNQTFGYAVDAAHTFTAIFAPIQYAITVNTSPGGLDSPYGGGTYNYGATANIGASSGAGYTFQYWKRDGVLYTYSQSFSYVVDAAHTFTAVFYTYSGAKTLGLDAILRRLGIKKTVRANVALKELGLPEGLSIDAIISEYPVIPLTGSKTVTLRGAAGAANDVYLYSDVLTLARQFGIGVLIRELHPTRTYGVDAAILKEVTAGYGVEVFLSLVSARVKEVGIAAALNELSIPELYEIGVVLEQLSLTNHHDIDAVLALRSHVSHAIDAAIQGLSSTSYGIDVSLSRLWNIPRDFSIGMYLVNPQKFNIAVSFEQFDANPSFETFEAVSSFDSLEVTPYFQEA